MRKAAFAALLLAVLVPLQAKALDTEELLGLVAMPLAVAAASEVTGVPVGELSHFVATLNRAAVPPTQVVQVVRYAPAALVVEEQEPAFVEYVDYQVDRGVTGTQLVTVIEERYRTYDLEPQFLTFDEPAPMYVVREDYIPEMVVTRVAQFRPSYVVGDTNDLLALAAMPLAVAAVADVTGIPLNDLSSLVASLNAARMPPVQVVEVLRYSPVVLVDAVERPQFLQFVSTQVAGGVTAPRLIELIDDRLQTYEIEPQFGAVEVTEVVDLVDDGAFFPAVVTSRVAEVRAHPHGGPPGQLKKQLGLQTGAEVVHGAGRGTRRVASVDVDRNRSTRVTTRRDRPEQRRVARAPRAETRRVVRAPRPEVRKVEVRRAEQPRAQRPKLDRQHPPKVDRRMTGGGPSASGGGQGRGQGQGQKQGQGQGQGKGKGKGKG